MVNIYISYSLLNKLSNICKKKKKNYNILRTGPYNGTVLFVTNEKQK